MQLQLTGFSFALVAASLLTLLPGCGAGSSDDADDTANSDLVAALGIVGEAIAGLTAIRGTDPARSACSAAGYVACNTTANTRTRSYSTSGGNSNGCTRDTTTVFGQAILSFTQASCRFTNPNDTISRTLQNHYVQDSIGRKILIYTGSGTVASKTITSTDLRDFNNVERSGGSLLTKGSASIDTLSISGIHRRSLKSNGQYGFWHTLYTTTALSVSHGVSSDTITSGELVLTNNRASTTISESFSSVVFTSDCCYPTSGSMTFAETNQSGSTTSTTVTFSSTCGSVSFGGTTITLPSCES